MILTVGCIFDSSGLPPSSPPPGGDGAGARDHKVTGDGPLARRDTRAQPPPDTASRGCPKGKIRCGKSCVSPSSDNANCGACGRKCKATERCISGLCCIKGWANCSKQCANLKADINNCGKCSVKCKATEACILGLCCTKGHSKCGAACVNLGTDKNNCGKCAHTCKATEACSGGKCAAVGACSSGLTPQPFGGGMVGCAGTVSFPKRATLCNLQYAVCSAQQWVSGHGAKAPKFNYWTNDVLHYVGPKNACFVSPSYGNKCWPGMPMRVCAGDPDPLGNRCNWQGCGYKTPAPKHFFGGCNDNPTAGTLCCPK